MLPTPQAEAGVNPEVVGWHVISTIPEELIVTALQRAFWTQPPTPGLLVNSDRGGQCCGNTYRKLLHDHEALRLNALNCPAQLDHLSSEVV